MVRRIPERAEDQGASDGVSSEREASERGLDVRRADDRVRISVQLVDTTTGRNVWSEVPACVGTTQSP